MMNWRFARQVRGSATIVIIRDIPKKQGMSWWQELIGKALFGGPYTPQERLDIADPFNFLMNQYLRFNQGDESPLLARTMARFPALGSAGAQGLLREVVAAYSYAAARQYDARDGQLSSQQADQDVRAKFPQLDEANLRTLLAQTLAGAYR